MVNLRDRVTKECFEEISPIFRRMQTGKIDSPGCEKGILGVLKAHRVPCPESLALFIAVVANGIVWEDVDPRAEPPKWFRKPDGLYITTKAARETSAALYGIS